MFPNSPRAVGPPRSTLAQHSRSRVRAQVQKLLRIPSCSLLRDRSTNQKMNTPSSVHAHALARRDLSGVCAARGQSDADPPTSRDSGRWKQFSVPQLHIPRGLIPRLVWGGGVGGCIAGGIITPGRAEVCEEKLPFSSSLSTRDGLLRISSSRTEHSARHGDTGPSEPHLPSLPALQAKRLLDIDGEGAALVFDFNVVLRYVQRA